MLKRRSRLVFVKFFITAYRRLKKRLRAFATRLARGFLKEKAAMAKYFSGLGPRRDCAKSQSQSLLRQSRLLVSLTALSILAACGGGGGGSPDPVTQQPPVTQPPVVVEKPTVTILSVRPTGAVASTSPITVDTAITRADTASLVVTATCGGVAVPLSVPALPTSGGQVSAMPTTGTLPDGATCDVSATVVANNASGTPVQATGATTFTVAAKVYYYERVNILITGEVVAETGNGTGAVAYPQIISGSTVTPVKNETGFQVGLCALTSVKLPNGLPGAWCTKPSNGNVRALFPIDPLRSVLMPEYTGTIPVEMVYYAGPYGVFGNSPYVSFGVSVTGMFIDVPGVGVYYYVDNNKTQLRLTRDGFATSEVVRAGPDNTLLMTYSNPAPAAN